MHVSYARWLLWVATVMAALASLTIFSPASATVTSSYCDVLQTPVPLCSNTAPRDLLFLVDGSESMSYDRFYEEMLEYCKALYCAFSPREQNQAGMILFKNDIKVVIPLKVYTRAQWEQQVDAIRARKDSQDEACCFCCTPLAEAFDLALDVFKEHAKTQFRIAFVITDGVPSNNNAGSIGGNPDWWYYNPKLGYNPAQYSATIVAESAKRLKRYNSRIFLVGIPNVFGNPPNVHFFSGVGKFNKKKVKYVEIRDGKKWNTYYKKGPNPIVSMPVNRNSFSMANWNVGTLLNGTVDALCEATFMPTQSPTFQPTLLPTKLPTKLPSQSPTTSEPTREPTRQPTLAPTGHPTRSPTTSQPSKSPTRGPTLHPTLLPTHLPTKLPSRAPTQSAPTFSPTRQPTKLPTRLPSQAPTTSTPTFSPSTRSPTLYPTKMDLTQVDVTFLVDRSDSMNEHNRLCLGLIAASDTIPEFDAVQSLSACWEVLMRYILKQVDLLVDIPAGKYLDRKLGWADDFPQNYTPAAGLRVNIVGFSCNWPQTQALMFEYSRSFLPSGPITNRRDLVDLLTHLVQTVRPTMGTCPALAIEKSVQYVEETSFDATPFQTVILVTDGIFYDGDAPSLATAGLESYKVTRFAVGIAIGLVTKTQQAKQREQLTNFVGYNRNFFKDLGKNGWSLLPSVAAQIAQDIAMGMDGVSPLPRGWWCGYRKMEVCASDNYRFGNCKWTGGPTANYKCMHPPHYTLSPTL